MARFLAPALKAIALIALIVLAVSPASASQRLSLGAGTGGVHHMHQPAHHSQGAEPHLANTGTADSRVIVAPAELRAEPCPADHGTCCGTSTGCCGLCPMLVPEAYASPESHKSDFLSALVVRMTGLPPPPLKRPPRAWR